MKFLFITTFNPFNHSSGGNQRSYLLCKSLCDIGQVDVVCIGSKKEFEDKFLPCRNLGTYIVKANLMYKFIEGFKMYFKCLFFRNECCYIRNKHLHKYIMNQLKCENYDFVVVRYMKTVYACGLENYSNLIVDIDDLPHLAFNTCVTSVYRGVLKRICEFIEQRIEFNFIQFTKKNILMFVSDGENILNQNLSFLPNIPIVDLNTDECVNCEKKKNVVFFVGLLSYKPNYIGLDHFIDNVWGEIIKSVPDAILKIGGKELPSFYKDKWSSYAGVKLLGYVDDLATEYATSKIFVSPIYTGGGTNIKILEAIKYNIPIVASPFSIRGYSGFLKDGKNIFIADNDSCFAKYIITLLRDDKLCNWVSNMALKSMSQLYSFSSFRSIVNDNIDNYLKKTNNGL